MMQITRRGLVGLAVLAMGVGTMVGCGVNPPPLGRLDPYPPPQIVLADRALKSRTAIGAPVVTRDEGGLLDVMVPIRSDQDEQLFIDYRTTFLDRNGQPLSQSAWIPKVLAPNVPDQITVNSMSPLAADFQIDLRYSK